MPFQNLKAKFAPLGEELSKIRGLPKGKRWEYIWEYYRTAFFFLLFSLFFVGALISFLVNFLSGTLFPKEPVSIAFAVTDFSNCESWMEACQAAIGYDEAEEKLQVMSTTPHNDTTEDFRITTTVWFPSGQPDIFVVDEASYQYLLEKEVLADISQRWPQPLQALAETYKVSDFALEISGTAFAEAYGISGEPVYLCMYINGQGFDRALDIVEYILENP